MSEASNDPAKGVRGGGRLKPEIRRHIDGTEERVYRVEACRWPPEGPSELWGLIAKPLSNYLIAPDRHFNRHVYKYEYFYQVRIMDGVRLLTWWVSLKYDGPYDSTANP